MFCPKCESEYINGIERCPTCDVPLVDTFADDPVESATEPEPRMIMSSSSAEAVAVAKSILIDAGIPFGVRGEYVQDLFGYGRFPTGNNVAMGCVEIVVPQSDEEVARGLLASLQDDSRVAPTVEDAEFPPGRSLWTLARPMRRIVAWLVLGGVVLPMIFAFVASLIYGD